MVVATEAAYITAPRVELLGDGTPVVLWGASTVPAQIWLSRVYGSTLLSGWCLYDADGRRCLLQKAIGKVTRVPVRDLAEGVYMLEVNTGRRVCKEKVVVQK